MRERSYQKADRGQADIDVSALCSEFSDDLNRLEKTRWCKSWEKIRDDQLNALKGSAGEILAKPINAQKRPT